MKMFSLCLPKTGQMTPIADFFTLFCSAPPKAQRHFYMCFVISEYVWTTQSHPDIHPE